jgi:hypothetical protein
MVQERGEPRLLSCFRSLPYAIQSAGHARPARRPARVGLARVPLGPLPSLPLLRPRLPGFVRKVLRYYGEARLLPSVHPRLQPLRPSRRGPARRNTARPGERSPRFRRDPFLRDAVFDHGRATAPRIAVPHVLPSTLLTVSASATFELSRLNSAPHRIAVYASCPPSPTTTQHSLAGARCGLPAPVFHRLDRASLPGAQAISIAVGPVAPRLLRFARNDSVSSHVLRVGNGSSELKRTWPVGPASPRSTNGAAIGLYSRIIG